MDQLRIWTIAECICEKVPVYTRLLIYSNNGYDSILEKTDYGYYRHLCKKEEYNWTFDIRKYITHESNLMEIAESVLTHLDL